MKRELKKQIKQDDLVSGFEHAGVFYREHHASIVRVAGALAVLALLLGGFRFWQEQRRSEAETEFAAAMEIFRAPVASELPPGPPPTGTVYATAVEKYKKAAAAFDGVERKFGSSPVGLRARYYSAVARMEAGESDAAQKLLAEIGSRRDTDRIEPALARLTLAELFRRSGQADKAVAAYRQLMDEAQSPLPKDHALMSLASTLEDARRFADACAEYRRLANEFPSSVYAAEARRRADYLETAGG